MWLRNWQPMFNSKIKLCYLLTIFFFLTSEKSYIFTPTINCLHRIMYRKMDALFADESWRALRRENDTRNKFLWLVPAPSFGHRSPRVNYSFSSRNRINSSLIKSRQVDSLVSIFFGCTSCNQQRCKVLTNFNFNLFVSGITFVTFFVLENENDRREETFHLIPSLFGRGRLGEV